MAISPLGNIVYVNQNMNFTAAKITNQLNRYELQNFMTAEMIKDKEKEVVEVRPAEEGHEVNPDRDHNKEQAEEKEKEKKEFQEEEGPHSDTPNLHILDVKV
jgi:hypothetical protein